MATIAGSRVSVELVHLAHAVIDLEPPLVLQNTPSGTRYVIAVRSARLEGERLKASAKGPLTGDLFTVGPEDTGTLDVRAMLETDDVARLEYDLYELR